MRRGHRVTAALYDIGDLIATPGTTYRVERVLGSGGMGDVYAVTDKNLGSLCVIKILQPDLSRSALRERFEHEARVIAQINHPNIVRVTRLGTLPDDARTPFYVMEFLVGQSLRAVLGQRKKERGGGLRIDQALNIGSQICYGLEAVHERGVVHRDMKPENVILHVDGRSNRIVKIIDFGVMRVLAASGIEGFAGTLGYAAPEQIRSDEVGPKADLFAFGLILFEMLTGRRPYEQYGTGEAGAVARLDVVAPSLDAYGEFPPALVKLVAKLLARAPADRPADAFTVAAGLEKISSALSPLDIHDAITDRAHEQVAEDTAASTAVRSITLADLAAPTDPDGEMPAWMRELRANAKRAEALGYEATQAQHGPNDTAPGAPPFLSNDTEPMAPRGATVPMAGRPAAPNISEMVTTPPSGRTAAAPASGGRVMYVDSIPRASPLVAAKQPTKSPSPPPAQVAAKHDSAPISGASHEVGRASQPKVARSSGRRAANVDRPSWKRQVFVFAVLVLCVTTVGVAIIAVRRPDLLNSTSRRSPVAAPTTSGGAP